MANSSVRSNVFSEEGRIPQVEYAIKNVANAGTIIGSLCSDGVLLLGIKRGIASSNKEKIYELDSNIYCAIAGIFSDSLKLINFARNKAQSVLEEYDVLCPINTIVDSVGALKHNLTQRGGMRPFGVSMLYCGFKDEKSVLYSTDPSGTCLTWKAKCFGEKEDAINNGLKDVVNENLNLEETTRKIFGLLATVKEFGESDAEKIELLHLSRNKASFIDKEKISELIRIVQAEAREKLEALKEH